MSTEVPVTGRVLGLDLGQRRIGVAASDDAQRLAVAVTTLDVARDPQAHRRKVLDMVEEYEAVGLVFGLPLGLSGSDTASTAVARSEMQGLAQMLSIPVDTVDERLSTKEAADHLRRSGLDGRKARQVVDMTAAAVLLQAWLDQRSESQEDLVNV